MPRTPESDIIDALTMLKSIRNFFDSKLAPGAEDEASTIARTDLACAALLVEVMNSDDQLDERETAAFLAVLRDSLRISEEDLRELVGLAESEARQATSLYEFTRFINDGYDYQQKVGLIENMWRIAFSDERLDKYEEHLIRRISELIYVSHSDFIRTKLKVRNTAD